ncbi:hypothetical protein LFYK43_14130 [Ligilactobacillus salitolerans]|uniref:Phage protein n=1 Tax=Ligilactobacillus salitolerans TaxID=1808352 RepID=A0A401ITW2_9LACO|nr:hypothetical protein [Ligilactobacillus salitolerans]GBG94954.1 hypothetical protein LFYK43_14130 [Ligilactobacillus salitolerans]
MSMSEEAIQYLMEQGIDPRDRMVTNANGQQYVIDNNGKPNYIKPHIYNAQDRLIIHTLSGLVDYIKSGVERNDEQLILEIYNERHVELYSLLKADGSREELVEAKAIIPAFDYGHFMHMEEFNIALQSKFKNNHDREILLQVVGNVADENVGQALDDGVSQSLTIKRGISSKAQVKVPNPVVLAPYRTFLEVEQPESQFIFRMEKGPQGAIFEADGGAWRNQAINLIREYLETELKEFVENKKIIVMA